VSVTWYDARPTHGSGVHLGNAFVQEQTHVSFPSIALQPRLNSKFKEMADKEATVFVIDLGATMASVEHGRKVSNLEWSMQYVWDKIMPKVFA
jgi:hypothetical protein